MLSQCTSPFLSIIVIGQVGISVPPKFIEK